MKKLLVLLLTMLMVLSLAACGPKDNGGDSVDTEKTYDEISAEVYKHNFSEFYDTYLEAKEEKVNLSVRYAKMAVAEAKLLESAVMLPVETSGGNYAISRVAPYTIDFTLWGSDQDRYHQAIIATEFITPADRDHLKAKWAELKGTGTYEAYVKSYLTGKGYTLTDEYSLGYSSDPVTWDALSTSRAADTDAIINTYDGLLEYDVEGTLQPALALGYEVSEDGLTVTFTLRQGVKWVDSQGRELAEVTADDFVAGFQHMLDAQGGLEYLVGVDGGCGIVGADEYIYGDTKDFADVGVKALDDYTLEYKLVDTCPFFMTMFGYSIFAPMNREYFLSKGGAFGVDEWAAAVADATYGKTPDDIAYNGPYLVTNATAQNKIVFSANPSYWNAENINVKTMNWKFNDGSDPLKAYNDALSGELSGAGLNTSALEIAKQDGNLDKYGYIAATNSTSYMAFVNLNRAVFANVADTTTVVSGQSEEDAARTNVALNNVHFRRALLFSMDRASRSAQLVGEDLKLNAIRNSYTPWNFVFLTEEVTVNLGSKEATFPAGTSYGEIMQATIDADGVDMVVYDPAAVNGGDGFDGWYNPAAAAAELAIAVEELKAAGVEVSAENPIHVDLPYPKQSSTRTNGAQAYKQSVEAATNGFISFDLVGCEDNAQWYYAGYYTDYGYEANYDLYDLSGWGPDYGDPQTYLDTMLPEYLGYMAKCFGIY